MKLKEKLSYFWNVTLGEDYKETEDIEKSNNPEYAELKESLERVESIENKFGQSASGKKGGKGNSGKDKLVETVVIDSNIATKAVEANKEVASKERDER